MNSIPSSLYKSLLIWTTLAASLEDPLSIPRSHKCPPAPPTPLPSQPMSLLLLLLINPWVPFVPPKSHGRWSIRRDALKNSISHFLSSHPFSITPPQGVGPFLSLGWSFDWLHLEQFSWKQPQLLWTIVYCNHIVSRSHQFIHSFPSRPPELLFSLHTLPWHFLSWKGGQLIHMSHLQVSTQNYLYSALWPVLCLCINHNPLHKEASLT